MLQTRLIDPALAKKIQGAKLLEALNERRIGVVQALRNEFGGKFVGGLVPNDYARARCPELLTEEKHGRGDYLDLVQDSTIVVYTPGRADSIGWRMGEYLAMSRCIVSERLPYDVPVELQDGLNVLYFDSVDECVAACDRALHDESLVQRIREANYRYYCENLKPSSLIANCLHTSIAAAGSNTHE